jgi:5'-nucleotidase
VMLTNGTPILPDGTTYTFTTDDFINAGGDSYTMFADGQGVTRELDTTAVLEHIHGLGMVSPTTDGRIEKLP